MGDSNPPPQKTMGQCVGNACSVAGKFLGKAAYTGVKNYAIPGAVYTGQRMYNTVLPAVGQCVGCTGRGLRNTVLPAIGQGALYAASASKPAFNVTRKCVGNACSRATSALTGAATTGAATTAGVAAGSAVTSGAAAAGRTALNMTLSSLPYVKARLGIQLDFDPGLVITSTDRVKLRTILGTYSPSQVTEAKERLVRSLATLVEEYILDNDGDAHSAQTYIDMANQPVFQGYTKGLLLVHNASMGRELESPSVSTVAYILMQANLSPASEILYDSKLPDELEESLQEVQNDYNARMSKIGKNKYQGGRRKVSRKVRKPRKTRKVRKNNRRVYRH